ncbi:MAG TPA: protein phosphatase 2C domain-containing protein [Pyrinomonadaceae bacterium]|jgi:protein phosphatase
MTEDNFQIESAAVSDRGLSEKRPQNEDSFLELKERGVYAVADGVGGAQAGDVASQMAVEILGEAFINSRPNIDAEEVMKAAIAQANAAIFQTSHELAQLSTMATTVVALHVSGNIATIGHVGDSRLYRLDGNGNLYRETQDHSVVEEEVRAGRMTPAQAATHPSRNVISRALGAEPTVEIDMKTIMFEPNTTFLLCSDGITRHIDDFEIRDLLSSHQTAAELAGKMKEICYERGAEDNLTAVIVKVGEAAAQQSTNGKPDSTFESDFESDFEEPTIAVARANMADEAPMINAEAVEADIPTQNLSMHDVAPQAQTEESTPGDYPETAETKPIVPKLETTASDAQNVVNAEPERKVINVETNENQESGFFGKLFSSLLLLIIGAVLGAGAYYYWMQNNKPPVVAPQITQMQSPNIPYTAFEDARRKVDDAPQNFINAVAASPRNAEDYYLLGRAYLLTGKIAEAKTSFDNAKNHLAEIGAVNSKVLATDIEAGLAIANNSFAYDAFRKNLSINKTDPAVPTNSNVVPANANVDTQNSNVSNMPVTP